MERFRFGNGEPNGRKMTCTGFLAVFERHPNLQVSVSGPKGATRADIIIDKAIARKLGAALLKWAFV
jgi:hypothetical protein